MATQRAAPEFALSHRGLRFLAAETEHAYRTWRNEQNVAVARLNAAVSIPAWLLGPLYGYLWDPKVDWARLWLPGYALAVPLLALALLSSYTRLRRHINLVSTLVLAVAGSVMVSIGIAARDYAPDFEVTGFACVALVGFACFALFLRLPPLLAILGIAPFVIEFGAWLLHAAGTGLLRPDNGFAFTVYPAVTCFFVAVMSVVQERFYRRAYVNERLLALRSASLERSRNLIRRYVPSALADQIIAGQAEGIETPQRRRVTILFADIVGFTGLADRLEPEVMTQVIGEYMAAMAGIIEDHRGTVNEFSGDGLMAIFGAPRAMDAVAQVEAAVRAAQAMQARLPGLNAGWRKLGLGAAMQIRIGINTGMASVGSYGSQGRMTYTAIGLQTNIAARLQAHCEPGGILLSEASWELVRDEIECAPRGEVQCKGVHFPVSVYSVSLPAADASSRSA